MLLHDPLIPLWLKLLYSAFCAVMIPVYWRKYGPTNFLYFCDVAIFLTLVGIWLESPLLISMSTVGILIPQIYWLVDFLANLCGASLSGMTDYMLDRNRSLFLRSISLFHGWLPLLLIYLVVKLGYDPRALPAWTAVAWILLVVCRLWIPPPNPSHGLRPVNINYVWGLSDRKPQTWVPSRVWFWGLVVGLPLLFFWPTHVVLRMLVPAAP